MKILCPTDFSNTSVNACRWGALFIESMGGGEMELLHCTNVLNRSIVFAKTKDQSFEQAKVYFKTLLADLRAIAPSIKFSGNIAKTDPKTFIPIHAKNNNFDYIITGTKGLTAAKDMTVGSVAAYLMDHTTTPLLVIPNEWSFSGLKKIVLGVGGRLINELTLSPLLSLINTSEANLDIVRTYQKKGTEKAPEPIEIPALSSIKYNYSAIAQGFSIANTLTEYCLDKQADLLVMIHYKRSNFERLFNNSLAKKQLFGIKTPLMVLPNAN